MHQNVFELIHKEDREDFQKQLLLHLPPTCSQNASNAITNGNASTHDDSNTSPETNGMTQFPEN